MKYGLLLQLIDLLNQYENESYGKETSLFSFSLWLSQKLTYPNPNIGQASEEAMEDAADEQGETALTMLISNLFRYSKNYAKKALEGTPLSTFDDFTFLARVSYSGSLTKTELIQMHLLEITSGIEIIKRLSKNGFLETFADPNDRRSKRVKLTDAGRDMLETVMARMDVLAHIFSGNLSLEERAHLLPLLHKLNDFHAVIHYQDKKTALEEILQKYFAEPQSLPQPEYNQA